MFATRLSATGAACVAAALVATGCSSGKDAVSQSAGSEFRYVSANKKGELIPADQRKMAGPMTGELLAGGTYRLADDKGSIVVLNMFASWCGPCNIETPQMDALYRERKASGVKFVGLDVKENTRSDATDWIKGKDITFPVVYDEKAKTALQLGNVPLAGLPDTVVIDRQGRVAAVYVGLTLPKDLTPALDALSQES
jgi:peroxiredoxin